MRMRGVRVAGAALMQHASTVALPVASPAPVSSLGAHAGRASHLGATDPRSARHRSKERVIARTDPRSVLVFGVAGLPSRTRWQTMREGGSCENVSTVFLSNVSTVFLGWIRKFRITLQIAFQERLERVEGSVDVELSLNARMDRLPL